MVLKQVITYYYHQLTQGNGRLLKLLNNSGVLAPLNWCIKRNKKTKIRTAEISQFLADFNCPHDVIAGYSKDLNIIFQTRYVNSCSATETNKRLEISRIGRKPVFGVSDQVRHKPGCTATEDG